MTIRGIFKPATRYSPSIAGMIFFESIGSVRIARDIQSLECSAIRRLSSAVIPPLALVGVLTIFVIQAPIHSSSLAKRVTFADSPVRQGARRVAFPITVQRDGIPIWRAICAAEYPSSQSLLRVSTASALHETRASLGRMSDSGTIAFTLPFQHLRQPRSAVRLRQP